MHAYRNEKHAEMSVKMTRVAASIT